MFQINLQNLNKINFLTILISLIPLTLILGNLAINLNIIFIIITGTIIFGKEIFVVKKKIYGFLIYSFFFFLIISTFFNNWLYLEETKYQEHLIKSLFYLRFLLFFLIINKILETKKFNMNLLFYSCAFFSFLISLDIIIQFIFKSNLIGYKIISNKPSSFFGEELIAGGYLQRFSLFLIFFIFLKYMPKKNQNLFLFFLFIIFLIPIILTGNRMPTLVMILSFLLYYLIQKKIKEILIVIVLIAVSVPLLDKLYDKKKFNVDLHDFFINSYSILINTPKLFYNNELEIDEKSWSTGYLTHFVTGIDIWKNNKIFGNGLKSFRIKCTYKKNRNTCNTHPHNYAIELLVDTGIVGLFLIYALIFIGSINFFKSMENNFDKNKKILSIVFFVLIFCEFFPIRSTGSFFTTNNSTFIFLIMPFFLQTKRINNLKIN